MKKILFALLCVLCAGSSYATRYKISDIYELAKANNTEELAKVSNINGHDMYKDTAICHAIKDGNVEAYKLLLAHGAKADHACTKKIPEQDYTKFMDKVAASSATKTTGFWGLSKWLWGALGLGVVGTGAVIAASGSGGGDSGTADNTNKCDGYIASCDTGYKVVDTCQSGSTTMVKCEFDDENYVKQNGTVYEKLNCVNGIQNGNACTCSMGYINDLCDTFDDVNFINISGTVYHKLNCQNGGTQVGNTCNCIAGWEGTLCDTAHNCGAEFTQTSCGTGYLETGTCKSGNTTYVSCTLDTDHYIEQNGQIYPKLNCQNGGTQNANTCNCVEGWTGTLCDTAVTCPANYKPACTGGYEPAGTEPCQSGDSTLVGCQEIQCGANATWSASGCNCEQGYENWQSGTGCSLIPLTCGNNAHQDGTQCVCESGYQNWQSNTGCSLIPINCNHGTQNGTACSCNEGWTGDKCDAFDDENYFMSGDGTVFPNQHCVNGAQVEDYCSCNEGWTGGTCNTPVTCSEIYKPSCTGGYEAFGTPCKSGNNLYYQCQPIECGTHALWAASGCYCEPGYENWQSGVGCSVPGINDTGNPKNKYIYSTTDEDVIGIETDDLVTRNLYIEKTANGNVTGLPSGVQNTLRNIYINKTGTGDIYGTVDVDNPGNILIENTSPGFGARQEPYKVYGIYRTTTDMIYNNAGTDDRDRVINIHNTGGATAYGMYGTNVTNAFSNSASDTHGAIYIIAEEDILEWSATDFVYGVDVYGIAGDRVTNAAGARGDITIIHKGKLDRPLGDRIIYGMYGSEVHNAVVNNGLPGTGSINIVFYTPRDAGPSIAVCGMGGERVYNENENTEYGQSTSEINIQNLSEGTAYGMVGTFYVGELINSGTININNIWAGGVTAMGAGCSSYGIHNSGTINITRESYIDTDGVVYEPNGVAGAVVGIGNNVITFAENTSGTINITSNGAIIGIYGSSVVNGGTVNITQNGNADVYGIKGLSNSNPPTNATSGTGLISIINNGTGNAYGISSNSTNTAYNAHADNDELATGIINIENRSSGNAYGMYGENWGWWLHNESHGHTTSEINIQNLSDGTAYGMYATNTINSGTIDINNISTGSAYGMFGKSNGSRITNSGTINITRNSYPDPLDNTIVYEPTGTAGDVFGIYADTNSTVNNSGDINITTNGNAYGIYVKSGSTVTNTGTISITTSGTAYGIYAEGNSTVTNSGTITLNGASCDGSTCDGSSSYGNHIVLNGSTLLNKGIMSAPQMNLNSMGGKVVAGLGSQFVVDNELSGDLNISSDVVMDGNQTTYVANNMIDAGDISKLNVRSASAMFDASLADNKHDIVMQMKDFNELTDNASLAQFLADNYAKGNGSDLFAALKSLENMSAFNGALAGLTGLDTFTQFAHEDLSAMREISFSMNNKLFENSSRDSFDISDSTGYFSFSNSRNGGSGQYGISSNKITDNLKLGYGMAMANINTGDDNGMHRQNKMWLFYMPATYTNDGYELVVAPKAGFARSEYNRRGYNNMNYDGYIEKRIFGLMNDLRYPLNFGNWTIAPDLAFNAIVYDQSGHEDEQEFSLIIPDDRTVSVETGLGFYTKYEKTLQDGSRFKLNSGFMVYREFGDTYDIKLGMRGMDGTFSLYNNDYEYRGAANIGFDYMAGRLHVYGNAQYFMDNDNYMNVKGGVSYRF